MTGDDEVPVAAPAVEIACDESGYEGERLVGGTTDVFTHGSVHMDLDAATECMAELRDRIRSPATEYKANHLLRQKHRPVLTWLLRPTGPLFGQSHVCLIDKSYFNVVKIIEMLLLPDDGRDNTHMQVDSQVGKLATTLYRRGADCFDPSRGTGSWCRPTT